MSIVKFKDLSFFTYLLLIVLQKLSIPAYMSSGPLEICFFPFTLHSKLCIQVSWSLCIPNHFLNFSKFVFIFFPKNLMTLCGDF